MFPTEPRAAIAALPHLLDAAPRDTLMIVAFDGEGLPRHHACFGIDGTRPLDEPLLASSLWGDDCPFTAAVLYSDVPTFSLRPLVTAWESRGRHTLQAAWAGPTRWRSFTCTADPCCSARGNRYPASLAGHDDFQPLPERPQDGVALLQWRRTQWTHWQRTIGQATAGTLSDPSTLDALARSLHDIPVRDALLAASAGQEPSIRPGLDAALRAMLDRSTLGTAVPLHTCVAALDYLDGNLENTALRVGRILEAEEYSLARLLRNGLEMRAPASLLARSFSHFDPEELLAA